MEERDRKSFAELLTKYRNLELVKMGLLKEKKGIVTVKDLMDQLSELDPNLYVFIPGYEGGYRFPVLKLGQEFTLNKNSEWYYGPHEATTGSGIKGITL